MKGKLRTLCDRCLLLAAAATVAFGCIRARPRVASISGSICKVGRVSHMHPAVVKFLELARTGELTKPGSRVHAPELLAAFSEIPAKDISSILPRTSDYVFLAGREFILSEDLPAEVLVSVTINELGETSETQSSFRLTEKYERQLYIVCSAPVPAEGTVFRVHLLLVCVDDEWRLLAVNTFPFQTGTRTSESLYAVGAAAESKGDMASAHIAYSASACFGMEPPYRQTDITRRLTAAASRLEDYRERLARQGMRETLVAGGREYRIGSADGRPAIGGAYVVVRLVIEPEEMAALTESERRSVAEAFIGVHPLLADGFDGIAVVGNRQTRAALRDRYIFGMNELRKR